MNLQFFFLLLQEDGWVVCRVFKKKCFFKTDGSEGSSSQGNDASHTMTAMTAYDQSRSLYLNHQHNFHHHLHPQTANLYKPELALHYPSHHLPTNPYSQIQVQDLLPNPRAQPAAYDFSVLPGDAAGMVNVDGCDQMSQHVGDQGREVASGTDWGVLDSMEGRYGGAGQQMNQMSQPPRGGEEMELWGYGK